MAAGTGPQDSMDGSADARPDTTTNPKIRAPETHLTGALQREA